MDCSRTLWSPSDGLQKALRGENLSAEHVPVSLPEKIADHVYEVCKPVGRPSIEIVVAHGLQLENYEAYMATWISQGKTECWLRWLLYDFPKARILIVSYASTSSTDEQGRKDMYVPGENLVHSLTRTAQVGQDGCPVLLIGHCLGGLVMKQLSHQALLMHSLDRSDEPVDKFLMNLKGLVYFGTPPGSIIDDSTAEFLEGPVQGSDLTTLNATTARSNWGSNEVFQKLRKRYNWKTVRIGELLPVNLVNVKGVLGPGEASSRHDMDSYYSATTDHYNLCRPRDRDSSTFQILAGFIHSLLKEAEEVSPSFETCSGETLCEAVGREAEQENVNVIGQKLDVRLLGVAQPPLEQPVFLKYPWTKGGYLGAGSFGTVYEAVDSDGMWFAVKEVSMVEKHKQAYQCMAQLMQEIQLLSQFKHDNIVQYLGTEIGDGKLYIFLELVSNGSLAAVLKRIKLSQSQISAYTRHILRGIKYLHDQRILHRDIKCANILVDGRGTCKLADFGMAKQLGSLNQTKSCKGSANWMAPEVIDPRKTYGLAADIWSLGCSVLEMATGSPPFGNMEWYQVLWTVGHGYGPSIPDSLSETSKDFIYRCLEINPMRRPTATKLLEHPFVGQA